MAEVKVKVQEGEVPVEGHEHSFTVKFKKMGRKYTVECKRPNTVLEAIKSHLKETFEENIDCDDENIMIKLGDVDASPFVATHFPCSCVEDDECLVISSFTKPVEAKDRERPQILPKERYSIFCINKEGGENTISKTKEIFRETGYLNQLEYFCVYGEKETSVEDALHRDGRFVDDLGNFTLSDINKHETITMSTQTVNNLHGRKFKICLPKKKRGKANIEKYKNSTEQQEQQKSASKNPQSREGKPDPEMKTGGKETTDEILRLAFEVGISLERAMKKTNSSPDLTEIYNRLCKQFPDLKRLMESRFPGETFQEILKLKKENFGKIQQSFSEVHRVREVLELSKSVCLLKISGPVPCSDIKKCITGTGFVLFDNFVLTNSHLFESWFKETEDKWLQSFSVTACFHVEKQFEAGLEFSATVFGGSETVDYALLQLIVDDEDTKKVPPGLLKKFALLPDDGEACIVGHPAGEVKRMDPTCVIEKDQRDNAVSQNLAKYRLHPVTIYKINQSFKKKPYADICVTYNTYMYHGSSGSPVFDGYGQVFGLHTGSFLLDFPKPGNSVIEYCYPLLSIFDKLIRDLNGGGHTGVLKRIQEEAVGNPYLESSLEYVFGKTGHKIQSKEDQVEGNEGESRRDPLKTDLSDFDDEMNTS